MLLSASIVSLCIECSWKGRVSKAEADQGFLKIIIEFSSMHIYFYTQPSYSASKWIMYVFFSLNYKRKQWPSSENFFISNILYPSCYCSLPFWGLGMTMGNLATSHPPISLENGFGSQPDCIVILLSITNVPDTQSIGEEVQWLERTPEDMANVISDLPGDL